MSCNCSIYNSTSNDITIIRGDTLSYLLTINTELPANTRVIFISKEFGLQQELQKQEDGKYLLYYQASDTANWSIGQSSYSLIFLIENEQYTFNGELTILQNINSIE